MTRYRRHRRRGEGCRCQGFRWPPAPTGSAASLRAQPDGEVLTSSGPYLKTKEHVRACGCWKPRTWTWRLPAGAGPVACRAKVKVRPFH
jgi:hypothetical protein